MEKIIHKRGDYMNSIYKSFYNNKSTYLQKDWGDVSSKECGNEIRKAVMDFENSLVVDKNMTKKHDIG
jgi:hypothetical protein